MPARVLRFSSLLLLWPALVAAQSPKAATYITDEQVKAVNALPGVDRQIISTDIGKLNLSVGIVHRGPTNAPAAAAPASGRPPAAPTGLTTGGAPQACGEASTAAAAPGTATGIMHDHQTETYIIVSGGGTLVTGGRIVNGRKSAADSQVTLVLNGPSCSGRIEGPDVVRKVVKTGDIIIIPAGVPHGWTDIADHVDYLSVRPDPDRVLAAYVNPALKK
jgi:mannose-6-phosphate isomerase-like protein (cupin superfamily)